MAAVNSFQRSDEYIRPNTSSSEVLSENLLFSLLSKANEVPAGFSKPSWRAIIVEDESQKRALYEFLPDFNLASRPCVMVLYVADTKIWPKEFNRLLKEKEINSSEALNESLESLKQAPISVARISIADRLKSFLTTIQRAAGLRRRINFSRPQIADLACIQTKLAAANFAIECELQNLETVVIDELQKESFSFLFKLSPRYIPVSLVCVVK